MVVGSSAQALEKSIQDWQLVCAEETCVISQTSQADDRTWLGTVQLVLSEDTTSTPVVFKVPEGVHLASGLFLADGARAPQQATWLLCEPGVCTAIAHLSATGLQAWRAGNTAEVRYRPRQDAPTISFDVSLMGLTQALREGREALR